MAATKQGGGGGGGDVEMQNVSLLHETNHQTDTRPQSAQPPSQWRSNVTMVLSAFALAGVVALLVLAVLVYEKRDTITQNIASNVASNAMMRDAISAALSTPSPTPTSDPGDLVAVQSNTILVGVLLDEIPATDVSRLQNAVLAWSDAEWERHARKQIGFTMYKMQFLTTFYSNLQQLIIPLEDAAVPITWQGAAYLANIMGHNLVVRPYSFSTYIVGTTGSACVSAKALCAVGGNLNIPWNLPIDPFLHNQRTLWACMDEDQFPHHSLDPENAEIYYDDTCAAGPAQPDGVECLYEVTGCHCTVGSNSSCKQALQNTVGFTHLALTYTRVAWNEQIAQQWESYNSMQYDSNAVGVNLRAFYGNKRIGFPHEWITYQYFTPDSCAVQECVRQPGWRKLVNFDSIHTNVGTEDMLIGTIAYKAGNASSFNASLYHNMYYWDPCHHHPHFSQYCAYEFDMTSPTAAFGHKQGFCIQSTNRIINSRQTSIWCKFENCSYQGIAKGWADNYNGGIPCQWVDITDDETFNGPVYTDLDMIGNPAHWLCEGQVIRNSDGSPQWQYSGNTTTTPPYPTAGLPVDVYKCVTSPGAWDDNLDTITILNQGPGTGVLTQDCQFPGHHFGPKRDCEFNAGAMMNRCTPGATVKLNCSIPRNSPSQVLRLCESSLVLGTSTACRFLDDSTLANVVITSGAATQVTFQCPVARDAVEIGGAYGVYTGPVLNRIDSAVPITCVAA